MTIDPTDIASKAIAGALTELFKEAVHGAKTLSKYLLKNAETSDILGNAARLYMQQLSDRFNQIKVIGMQGPVPLEQIYTKVRVLDRVQKSRQWTGIASTLYPVGTIRQGIDVVNDTHRVAILGRPGSGKTTFLRHILLQALHGQLKEPRVPIYVILNDSSEMNNSVLSLILNQFASCGITDVEPFVKNLLEKGRCVVLLDGVDEVPASARQRVIHEITTLSNSYNKTQFVVSCRAAAYNYWFEKFSDFEIADFDDADIDHFVHRWFCNKPNFAYRCLAELRAQASIYQLGAVPLFLAMICVAYEETLRIAPNRADLYRTTIDVLLSKWDASRGVSREEPNSHILTNSRKLSLLSEVAAVTFERGEFWLRTEAIVQYIANYLARLPQAHLFDAESVLDMIEAHHGILIERARGVHGFSHLTFHEYLTAAFISERGDDLQTMLVQKYAQDPKWREVIVLVAILLPDASKFLLELLEYLVKIGASPRYIKQLGNFKSTVADEVGGRLIPYKRLSAQSAFRWQTVPKLEDVTALVQKRRASLDLNSALRCLGTKVAVDFILDLSSKQRTVTKEVEMTVVRGKGWGGKETVRHFAAGNTAAETFAFSIVQACNEVVEFNSSTRSDFVKATGATGRLSSLKRAGQWKATVREILPKDVCMHLVDILPPRQAQELLENMLEHESDAKSISIYEDAIEYHKRLVDTVLYIREVLNITPESDKEIKAFPTNAEKAISKWSSGSAYLRDWQAVHISELILNILQAQVAIKPDIRDAALCTLEFRR